MLQIVNQFRQRIGNGVQKCLFHLTTFQTKNQSGHYKVTRRRTRALTYEMAQEPFLIGQRKTWNSINTSALEGVSRASKTAVEDLFIRKFMTGTWHNLFLTEIIIKRQHNIVRIAGVIHRSISPRKIYFLIGYTEELLSYWLQCIVKLELQTTANRTDVIFKYI